MVNLLKIAGLLVEDAFRGLLLLFRSAEALRAAGAAARELRAEARFQGSTFFIAFSTGS